MNDIIPLYDYNRRPSYLDSLYTPVVEETPESILAKISPKKVLKLLDDYSERKHQDRIYEISSSVVQTYMNNLNPEDEKEIKGWNIEKIERGGFLGFGKKEKGIRITFERWYVKEIFYKNKEFFLW